MTLSLPVEPVVSARPVDIGDGVKDNLFPEGIKGKRGKIPVPYRREKGTRGKRGNVERVERI
jgi:hypothetical protein